MTMKTDTKQLSELRTVLCAKREAFYAFLQATRELKSHIEEQNLQETEQCLNTRQKCICSIEICDKTIKELIEKESFLLTSLSDEGRRVLTEITQEINETAITAMEATKECEGLYMAHYEIVRNQISALQRSRTAVQGYASRGCRNIQPRFLDITS